ncbi:MAG: hypothetical protein HUJ98_07885, partial [Bacteroidaceae bacterium]|nr:hypothetical protein [Bacteroidaceae bacterium]
EALKKAKGSLPNVTFNGEFNPRGRNIITDSNGMERTQGVVSYSQVTALDFDKIPTGEFNAVRQWLMNDPYVILIYTTPSGMGFRAIVRHDNSDPLLHWNLYGQIIARYEACPYLDHSVSDLSRVSYLSYDPSAYFNPSAAAFPFSFDPSITKSTARRQPSKPTANNCSQFMMTQSMEWLNTLHQASWKDKAMMDYIDKHQWSHHPEDYQQGNRNDSLIKKAAQLCRCGIHYDNALWKLSYLYTRDPQCAVSQSDIDSRVSYAYTTNCAYFGDDRQKWLDRRNSGNANYSSRKAP